jgi:holliday junction DNA helicase RuvB
MKDAQWRPQRLHEFIGQGAVVKQLQVEIAAAIKMRRPLRNALYAGPPGLGKSLLARIVTAERGSPPPKVVMGRSLTHEQISTVLLELDSPGYAPNGVLQEPAKAVFPVVIVEEAQRVNRELLNLLHPALVPDSKGRRVFVARSPRGDVGHKWAVQFTLIFITNYAGEFIAASPATASRLPIQFTFEWYTDAEMAAIIAKNAWERDIAIKDNAVAMLAALANGMPRKGIELVDRAIDFLAISGDEFITKSTVEKMLDALGIDGNGLDRQAISYLKALMVQPHGRMSIQCVATVLGTDQTTLTHCVEPVLIKRGLIMRNSSGREITPAGRHLIGGNNHDARNIAEGDLE